MYGTIVSQRQRKVIRKITKTAGVFLRSYVQIILNYTRLSTSVSTTQTMAIHLVEEAII